MEIILAIVIVIIGAIAIGRLTKGSEIRIPKNKNFKDVVKKTFPKYKIIEKNQQIMICEINHRNEPDELIFIKIGGTKNIRKSGRMLIATYPKEPTPKEMKRDFGKHLN